MDYTKRIDYSSLSCYLDCPRKFLFQYMLHMRSTQPNIDLTFGSAWHYGLEMAYKGLQRDTALTTGDLTEISRQALNTYWKVAGEPHFPDSDAIFPKSPGHAASMYSHYWELYHQEDSAKEIVGVELPFSLPIHNDIHYIGRLDLVLKNEDQVQIIDHKTGKAVYAISLAGYESSLQTDGYLTVGKLYFDKLPTMTYSLALCQKSKIAFDRFDILKRDQSTERFLDDLAFHIQTLTTNIEIMNNELPFLRDKVANPVAFKRNPGYACTQFFRKCQFFDLCMMRNNPYLWKDSPPQGYIIEEWDPSTHEAKIAGLIAQVEE